MSLELVAGIHDGWIRALTLQLLVCSSSCSNLHVHVVVCTSRSPRGPSRDDIVTGSQWKTRRKSVLSSSNHFADSSGLMQSKDGGLISRLTGCAAEAIKQVWKIAQISNDE